eukprot:3937118-Rhodomonas_salina.1
MDEDIVVQLRGRLAKEVEAERNVERDKLVGDELRARAHHRRRAAVLDEAGAEERDGVPRVKRVGGRGGVLHALLVHPAGVFNLAQERSSAGPDRIERDQAAVVVDAVFGAQRKSHLYIVGRAARIRAHCAVRRLVHARKVVVLLVDCHEAQVDVLEEPAPNRENSEHPGTQNRTRTHTNKAAVCCCQRRSREQQRKKVAGCGWQGGGLRVVVDAMRRNGEEAGLLDVDRSLRRERVEDPAPGRGPEVDIAHEKVDGVLDANGAAQQAGLGAQLFLIELDSGRVLSDPSVLRGNAGESRRVGHADKLRGRCNEALRLRGAGHRVLGLGRPVRRGGVNVRAVVSARTQGGVCRRGVRSKALGHAVLTQHTLAVAVAAKRLIADIEPCAEAAASGCNRKGRNRAVGSDVVAHSAREVGRRKGAHDVVVRVVVVVRQGVTSHRVRQIERVERLDLHRVARPGGVRHIDRPAARLRAGWLKLDTQHFHARRHDGHWPSRRARIVRVHTRPQPRVH